MRVTIFGSGTSTGVPVPGCECAVCNSNDHLNRRLRTSALLQFEGKDRTPTETLKAEPELPSPLANILIDTSTDLRYQALRSNTKRIDAVLYTHTHADHIYGLDDLRSFNFASKKTIPVYASDHSANELERIFNYVFSPNPDYVGGAPPDLTLTRIKPYEPITLFGVEILPLSLEHGPTPVLGFRIGRFAYLTDCCAIPERTREQLTGLDYLILDGLRIRPHRTHFTFAQAVAEVEKIKPKRTYLTHISHEVEHHAGNTLLREMTKQSVELAYDGLVLEI